MSKENLKKISVDISEESWKKIKILSIQKGITLQKHLREILESKIDKMVKVMSSKNNHEQQNEEM